jgi:hypothetical protein
MSSRWRWVTRHQGPVLAVVLVVVIWGALWVVYDDRSPISQFLRGVGTIQMDGWSAYDLDTVCVRLDPASGTPKTTAEDAIAVARQSYPGGYVRDILLVSFHDTCEGGGPRLAWAVGIAWADPTGAPAPTGSRPRAIVVVDAASGQVIVNHAEHAPAFIPSPTPSPSPSPGPERS